jgi:UDP-N-acetyl-D-mannosaminuronic acid dehydrogenase
MSIPILHDRIKDRSARLAVIGLGYVGLPVAVAFAQAGFNVLGVDIRTDRVAAVNRGHNPIEGREPGLAELIDQVTKLSRLRATTEYREIAAADVVIVAVETPVDDNHRPSYTALKSACDRMGPLLKRGTLVIVESTVAPGTLSGVVQPILERGSGGRLNEAFFLGTCPERVMPGRLLHNLRHMGRVCGGATEETAQVMTELYGCVVEAELDMADMVTAELVKTTENAYRDVQIAFANEVALICEATGGDVWRVRELVNKAPYRHMHLPGSGVGGHCIPKDPWLLAYGAAGRAPIHLIPAARVVNDGMPQHVAELTIAALREAGLALNTARVLILGYSYLEESDDTRNSPSIPLVRHLIAAGVTTLIHDPWVMEYRVDLSTLATAADALVLMVTHQEYRDLDLPQLCRLMRTPILIDGRHLFNRAQAETAGFHYACVGQDRRR